MRLDETEKAVRVFLIVAAPDPLPELAVRYEKHPTPILPGLVPPSETPLFVDP
jgi:hypothetical protein